MLTSSSPSDQTAFAVTQVVDCEPPARDVRQCRPPSPAALRRRNAHVPQRHSSHHQAPPAPAMSAPMHRAARFADAALRRVLEVIDRRRPISQLNGLLAAGLVDSVLSANRLAGADGGVAVLRRVRLQAVGSPDGFAAAEVFGSYSRGPRMHAVACRIESVGSGRWQVVALHIG
ncbi:MAG TPA: Rv3235 family protein [Mycobacterium sp.]|uniref:Rv3235 family protein n=1 Tax=Mycobacterium sp. TaxID=1785 RepID=UPI002F42D029